jgi:phosphopentomutase
MGMKRQEKQQGSRNLMVYLVLKTPQERIEEIREMLESYFDKVYVNTESYYMYCINAKDSVDKIISDAEKFPEVQSFDIIQEESKMFSDSELEGYRMVERKFDEDFFEKREAFKNIVSNEFEDRNLTEEEAEGLKEAGNEDLIQYSRSLLRESGGKE